MGRSPADFESAASASSAIPAGDDLRENQLNRQGCRFATEAADKLALGQPRTANGGSRTSHEPSLFLSALLRLTEHPFAWVWRIGNRQGGKEISQAREDHEIRTLPTSL